MKRGREERKRYSEIEDEERERENTVCYIPAEKSFQRILGT